MVAFVVCVHQDIQEVDVKFVMHVKVIHAWMEERANPLMVMVAINVYALLVLVVHDVKLVRILHVFIYSQIAAL